MQKFAAGLAISRHGSEDAYDLFGCDSDWNGVTYTWHLTLEDALRQAELEDEDVSKTWQARGPHAGRPGAAAGELTPSEPRRGS